MGSEDAGSYTDFAPPGIESGSSAETRVEWVLEETLRSRRFAAAMVVGTHGWALANRGFDNPDRVTTLAPESIRLLNALKEAFPGEAASAGRQAGEAASFAGFGEPEAEERNPEFVVVSLDQERKLLFRPLEVQGESFTLVLLTRGLAANTDAVLEGIGRAVSTCLATNWSRQAES
ncbi:hypothetical protein [Thiohalorhabdus sp.]|uniref:hypothetical protein n=1 Tax=Thiohalorhabdus sp. TaxID=3094134 RepID=UPI002FC367D7